MSKLMDITGETYGRLTVISRAANSKRGLTRWVCSCGCGNKTTVNGGDLKLGKTKSCGCLNKDLNKTHGMTGTHIYFVWRSMRNRCNSKSNPYYSCYGGRGIKVCERWNSLENFIADMGEPEKGMTLDRIDNNGDYKPSNCRWATQAQQNRNYRRNINISFNGKTQCLTDWANEIGISAPALKYRLNNWPLQEALTKTAQRK